MGQFALSLVFMEVCVSETARTQEVHKLIRERDEARIEAQTLRALLISRHGGEMLTLMQELDAAKEEITRLRRHLGEIP